MPTSARKRLRDDEGVVPYKCIQGFCAKLKRHTNYKKTGFYLMKTLYFDCFSGISGDMCLAALLDLGVVSADDFLAQMSKLNFHEYNLHISKTQKNGIAATDVDVCVCEHEHNHHHDRDLQDILCIIQNSGISDGAKRIAADIFGVIAAAEARVHGVDIAQVHFHEVGAVDSIVDIVGAAVLIDMLGVEAIQCSLLSEGHGFVKCQHGLIPIPVPATVQILSEAGLRMRGADIESELITPTGAGIIAVLAQKQGDMPSMIDVKIGYGAGKKDFSTPNLLRVFLGDDADKTASDEVTVIETNIDDMTGENAGFVMDELLKSGALDVFFVPIQMKKNRPGIMLSVLCKESDAAMLEDIIFTHTPTIGIRRYTASRRVLCREIAEVQTPWGIVRVKVSRFGGITKTAPEYDDVARIVRDNGVPFDMVYKAAKIELS